MSVHAVLDTLDEEGLARLRSLPSEAIDAVTERFYAAHGSAYARFGQRGRDACRDDFLFHLEFLRPVLEFGLLQPMADYLRWLDSVLAERSFPADYVGLSLDCMAAYLCERMDAANAAVVRAALRAARADYLRADAVPLARPAPAQAWPEAAPFQAALLAGSQRAALAIMNDCLDRGQDFVGFGLHVIQPTLYLIGELWQANQCSVAQEHMATAIAQSVMTIGLLRSASMAPTGKRVLLACIEGNQHAIGLRMVADAFTLAGWDVRYLGADVPAAALFDEVAQYKPDLVGLSVSFAQQMSMVRTVIVQLRERFGSARPPVMIGGLAINRFEPLAAMAGADSHQANASTAVAAADRGVDKRGLDARGPAALTLHPSAA